MYDTIIIGGGPAGMALSLNLLRAGRSTLILEKESFGGQIAKSPRVENLPSIKEISGLAFSDALFDQISGLGAEFDLGTVTKIEKLDNTFKVYTDSGEYEARSVAIANGVVHRTTGLETEEKFVGHGISYCATCDGAFYKDEDVVVIGDANTALQYALSLSNYCKSVQIITLFDKFFADKVLVDRIKERSNMSYKMEYSVTEFVGDDELTEVRFVNTKTKEPLNIKCKCVFVAIGQIPNNEMFSTLVDLDRGYIVTDEHMQTKTPGVFAIGDTRKKDVRQVATAVNDASIASFYIDRFLHQ